MGYISIPNWDEKRPDPQCQGWIKGVESTDLLTLAARMNICLKAGHPNFQQVLDHYHDIYIVITFPHFAILGPPDMSIFGESGIFPGCQHPTKTKGCSFHELLATLAAARGKPAVQSPAWTGRTPWRPVVEIYTLVGSTCLNSDDDPQWLCSFPVGLPRPAVTCKASDRYLQTYIDVWWLFSRCWMHKSLPNNSFPGTYRLISMHQFRSCCWFVWYSMLDIS